MPRISGWKPNKTNDFKMIDNALRETLFIGGVGVLIHKYIGTSADGDISDIDDVLFLENRERHYETYVYEGRCVYTPTDTEFDLSQFGIFLSSDVMRFDFHYNDMVDILGRKLVAGDVLEFPNMRETSTTGESLNRFYVVNDALYSASGYSATWRPHIWRVKGKQLQATPEFQDIVDKAATNSSAGGIGEGLGIMPLGFSENSDAVGNTYDQKLAETLNIYCKLLDITDEVVAEAEENAFFDPKFMVTQHLFVCLDENGYPGLQRWQGGDGLPPNGGKLRGMGNSFPSDMMDGEYFLRLDYTPDRLFQKQGKRYVKIEDDLRKLWTAYNRVLDTFIDNSNVTTFTDGSSVPEKQALNKVLLPKTDIYANDKARMKADEVIRQEGDDEC